MLSDGFNNNINKIKLYAKTIFVNIISIETFFLVSLVGHRFENSRLNVLY